MNATQKLKATLPGAARELRVGVPAASLVPARDKRSLIQWATNEQIQEVSKQLAAINQAAIRSEAEGDYFKSGDLAYQVQEIIRAAAELHRKVERAQG
jgi:hypothetical protein